MKYYLFILLLSRIFIPYTLFSQTLFKTNQIVNGILIDAETKETIPYVHIISKGQKKAGTVSNSNGRFSISIGSDIDSLLFSCVGYASLSLSKNEIPKERVWQIKLTPKTTVLKEIAIQVPNPVKIIKAALQAISHNYDTGIFEQKGFYREIIKDPIDYLSIAEAQFRMVSNPYLKKGNTQLQLVKGRSSEQVRATRLFEDFHPAGGPQITAFKSLQHSIPSFLQPKQIDKYDYFLEGYSNYEGHEVYEISFDQKPYIKEALQKGKVFITVDGFAVINYISENSPRGIQYTKHLTGSDKFFATLLNINFTRKSTKYRVGFRKNGKKWYLNDASFIANFQYQQKKKDLDLELSYQAELLMTETQHTDIKPILPKEKWQKNQLLLNLPTKWDASFWGEQNFIAPEKAISETVEQMQKERFGESTLLDAQNNGWQQFNEQYMISYQHQDTLVLQPTNRCLWFRQGTGPMLFQTVSNDFAFETLLQVTQNKDKRLTPVNGFQTGGIVLRDASKSSENHMAVWLGTRGGSTLKLSTQLTTNSKSKVKSESVEQNYVWLRVSRKNTIVSFEYKWNSEDEWEALFKEETAYPKSIELGLATFAHFAGNGPNMYPDISAYFIGSRVTQTNLNTKLH